MPGPKKLHIKQRNCWSRKRKPSTNKIISSKNENISKYKDTEMETPIRRKAKTESRKPKQHIHTELQPHKKEIISFKTKTLEWTVGAKRFFVCCWNQCAVCDTYSLIPLRYRVLQLPIFCKKGEAVAIDSASEFSSGAKNERGCVVKWWTHQPLCQRMQSKMKHNVITS